jgi:oligopeptide transport system ATP-binding protein
MIEVKNLKKYFPVTTSIFNKVTGHIKAVNDVSFSINRGETFGLVGESGCGKTTTAKCILQLNKPTSGQVLYKDVDLTRLSAKEMRKMRSDLQLVFQEPFASLDPRMPVEHIIGEPLIVHGMARKGTKAYKKRVYELMEMVELEPYMAVRYAHEFSGGQRQRIGIARALSADSKFIVCDEPVSALDVSVQAQILNLLKKLQKEKNLTYLFIAHDLAVVRNVCDRVAVMYLGKIVEITSSDELYAKPLHPYTISLLSAVPVPDPAIDRKRKRFLLPDDVPSPINLPAGCSFHPRCYMAKDICGKTAPELRPVDDKGHYAACHFCGGEAMT